MKLDAVCDMQMFTFVILCVEVPSTVCSIHYTLYSVPRNQSCYRQITSYQKDSAVIGVGQW